MQSTISEGIVVPYICHPNPELQLQTETVGICAPPVKIPLSESSKIQASPGTEALRGQGLCLVSSMPQAMSRTRIC